MYTDTYAQVYENDAYACPCNYSSDSYKLWYWPVLHDPACLESVVGWSPQVVTPDELLTVESFSSHLDGAGFECLFMVAFFNPAQCHFCACFVRSERESTSRLLLLCRKRNCAFPSAPGAFLYCSFFSTIYIHYCMLHIYVHMYT